MKLIVEIYYGTYKLDAYNVEIKRPTKAHPILKIDIKPKIQLEKQP